MDKLLKNIHYDEAIDMFNDIKVATQVAKELCDKYDIEYNESEGRKVRNWLNPGALLPLRKDDKDYLPKVLIYDIETSQAVFKAFWPGKQYLRADQIIEEPKIITIAFKWLGEDDINVLTWDENRSDKQLIKDFLPYYNQADLVIGYNNDKFDNKWINARAAKFNYSFNTYLKSLDLMKKVKKYFRVPGYSLNYVNKYFGIPNKLDHSGIKMWDKIQFGTKEESEEALKEMISYNIQDIVATEHLYLKLVPHIDHSIHLGVLMGESKLTCPNCGGSNLEHYTTTVTKAGTVQYIMQCKDDGVQFKLSTQAFLRWQKEQYNEN